MSQNWLAGLLCWVASTTVLADATTKIDLAGHSVAQVLKTSANCASCHADVAASWQKSAHHFSSFNNPYYAASVDAFRVERGNRKSRFCGGCHDPALIASGAIDRAMTATERQAATAQAGIVCLVCHSIDAPPSLDGNGGYHATMSAVPDGKAHAARLRPALLSEARLCVACHKVGLDETVTADHWIRGQDEYDAWQSAAVSGQGVASAFRPKSLSRCQDCHMPQVVARLGDAAAKNGLIRSHQFVAANAALPHLHGDAAAEQAVAESLRGRVSLRLFWNDKQLDAVLHARGIGHRFPGGTADSNQVWLEVKAYAEDRLIASSGVADSDGRLALDSHLLRAQPVDEGGQPITRRDVQHVRGVAFDTSLSPSDPQAVRFAIPAAATRVDVRLLYRKFDVDYAAFACAEQSGAAKLRCLAVPIVEIAAATMRRDERSPEDVDALIDYGLALADGTADHASDAAPYLTQAQALAPLRVEPLIGLGRLAVKLGQTANVLVYSAKIEEQVPHHPAALAMRTTALLEAYRASEALSSAEQLVADFPRDRQALSLLARVRGLCGDAKGALAIADRLIAIDPGFEEGHYQRTLALRELGRRQAAAVAESNYLRYRTRSEMNLALRQKMRVQRGPLPDESEPLHVHELLPVGDAIVGSR